MENNEKRKRVFQTVVNVLVVILVLLWVGEFIWGRIPVKYDYYDGLPDDVEQLDITIESKMDSLPETPELFSPDYANPEIPINFNKNKDNPKIPPNEIYKQHLNSIAYINVVDSMGFYSMGSGSIIGSNGIILTNYHIIEGASKVVVTFSDGTTYPVTDVRVIDKDKDIAVLKIDADNVPAIPIGDSSGAQIGDSVYVIGHPENFLFSLSDGIISGIRSYTKTNEGTQFQITNPISAGSSGGTLLNDRGELIGIPSSLFEYEMNSVNVQNINFAIPIASVLDILMEQ